MCYMSALSHEVWERQYLWVPQPLINHHIRYKHRSHKHLLPTYSYIFTNQESGITALPRCSVIATCCFSVGLGAAPESADILNTIWVSIILFTSKDSGVGWKLARSEKLRSNQLTFLFWLETQQEKCLSTHPKPKSPQISKSLYTLPVDLFIRIPGFSVANSGQAVADCAPDLRLIF